MREMSSAKSATFTVSDTTECRPSMYNKEQQRRQYRAFCVTSAKNSPFKCILSLGFERKSHNRRT